MLLNQRFNLSVTLDDDFEALQLKRYLNGDKESPETMEKLERIENSILTI